MKGDIGKDKFGFEDIEEFWSNDNSFSLSRDKRRISEASLSSNDFNYSDSGSISESSSELNEEDIEIPIDADISGIDVPKTPESSSRRKSFSTDGKLSSFSSLSIFSSGSSGGSLPLEDDEAEEILSTPQFIEAAPNPNSIPQENYLSSTPSKRSVSQLLEGSQNVKGKSPKRRRESSSNIRRNKDSVNEDDFDDDDIVAIMSQENDRTPPLTATELTSTRSKIKKESPGSQISSKRVTFSPNIKIPLNSSASSPPNTLNDSMDSIQVDWNHDIMERDHAEEESPKEETQETHFLNEDRKSASVVSNSSSTPLRRSSISQASRAEKLVEDTFSTTVSSKTSIPTRLPKSSKMSSTSVGRASTSDLATSLPSKALSTKNKSTINDLKSHAKNPSIPIMTTQASILPEKQVQSQAFSTKLTPPQKSIKKTGNRMIEPQKEEVLREDIAFKDLNDVVDPSEEEWNDPLSSSLLSTSADVTSPMMQKLSRTWKYTSPATYSTVSTPDSHEFPRGQVVTDESFHLDDYDGERARKRNGQDSDQEEGSEDNEEEEEGENDEGTDNEDLNETFASEKSFIETLRQHQESMEEEEDEEEDQDSSETGIRRSRRVTRGKRFEYWKNERPVYEKGKMVGVLLAMPTPQKASRKSRTSSTISKRPSRVKKSNKIDSIIDAEENENVFGDDSYSNSNINRDSHNKYIDDNNKKTQSHGKIESLLPLPESLLPTDRQFLPRQDASEVLRVWDNENDTVQESRCLAFRESLYPLTPLPITSSRNPGQDKVGLASQAFVAPSIADKLSGWMSGYFELPPGAIKDPEPTGDCTQIYFVQDCQAKSLELGLSNPATPEWHDASAQRLLLSSGDSFFVPPANYYRLENHSLEAKATLFWVIINSIEPSETKTDEK